MTLKSRGGIKASLRLGGKLVMDLKTKLNPVCSGDGKFVMLLLFLFILSNEPFFNPIETIELLLFSSVQLF